MKLSVVTAGIRNYNWKQVYQSLSYLNCEWELIFIGPEGPLQEIGHNVKFIHDYGCPTRCIQRGLIESQGEWITWCPDDGYSINNGLNKSLSLVSSYKDVVMGKYLEGSGNGMTSNEYYLLNYHDATKSPFIPKNYYIFNMGIVSRQVMMEIGGWDCKIETWGIANCDLAVRLQRYGCKFIVQDEPMYQCSHMPGTSGDHGPVHYSQIENDEPLYKQIYSSPACLERIKIDINNWKTSPEKWSRRFK